MNPYNEKRNRDRAFLGAAHDIVFDDEIQQTDTPDFDAGARPAESPGAPPPRTWASDEPGGWRETEIEASLLFPCLEDERG